MAKRTLAPGKSKPWELRLESGRPVQELTTHPHITIPSDVRGWLRGSSHRYRNKNPIHGLARGIEGLLGAVAGCWALC